MSRRILLPVAMLALVAGCFDPIVGGECATGYTRCGNRCVDLATSADNCGACGAACVGGTCRGGACTGTTVAPSPGDGGATDAGPTSDTGTRPAGDASAPPGLDGARGSDATGGAAGAGGGATDATVAVDAAGADAPASTDAAGGALDAATDAPADAGAASDADLPTFTDAAAGDAGASGAGDTGAPGAGDDAASAPADASAADAGPPPDALVCPMGQMNCGGTCIDTTSDPDNCGGCQFRCASGLCMASTCQAQRAGHLVVIGHDFVVGRPGADYLVGNAVFLAFGNPVKVLAYEGDASAAAIVGTNAAIQQVATDTGRAWVRTVAGASDVPARLADADVLVIYGQQNATDATLNALGTAWAAALKDYVNSGKIVVLLDAAYAGNAGTYQIVQQAGLFKAAGRTDATGDTMTLVSPNDAVATRVPRNYRGETNSVRFDSTDQNAVVKDSGQPVVIHAVF